jgi:predicted AAA+ superfamily ATPase
MGIFKETEGEMKRDIEQDLVRWKNQKQPFPLLLRGARQVGKSYIVEKFGKEHFDTCLILNFERNPEYKKCFSSLDPLKITSSIELITGKRIEPGSTLLFLDEIQECPQAVMALRSFKEEMPQLHVIGAGSLLEFILNHKSFRMPVGRVQFMYLRPLSFGEYLDASGHSNLRKYLKGIHVQEIIEDAVHEKLLSLVREYFALGGMPAVVSSYLELKSLLSCQEIQTSILTAYRKDFGKWLKYSTLDPNVSSSILKSALRKLREAGLVLLIYATSGAGLP